tara:strand:+ start:1013 stop:1654 length:642 start_codon:yes stop_codon:yes gene_type:complete
MSETSNIIPMKVQLKHKSDYLKFTDNDGNRLDEPVAMSIYRVSGSEDAIALYKTTRDFCPLEKDAETGLETGAPLLFTSEDLPKSFELTASASEKSFYRETPEKILSLKKKNHNAKKGTSQLKKLVAEVNLVEAELGTTIESRILNAFALMKAPTEPVAQSTPSVVTKEAEAEDEKIVEEENKEIVETNAQKVARLKAEAKAKAKAEKAIDGE